MASMEATAHLIAHLLHLTPQWQTGSACCRRHRKISRDGVGAKRLYQRLFEPIPSLETFCTPIVPRDSTVRNGRAEQRGGTCVTWAHYCCSDSLIVRCTSLGSNSAHRPNQLIKKIYFTRYDNEQFNARIGCPWRCCARGSTC